MKYLRSLMQQSVTACKNQAKLIQQFTLSLLYLLIIHIVALLFFFLFRLVLFTSIDYQFPPDIQNNFLMQATAFIKGLWFDNVIACYILLLPLVILWITALCNYHSKWVFRFISIFFILFYSLSFIISIIRKSKFPQNPKRSVRFSGKRTKRSVQKRKARNTQKAETKVL